MKITSAAPTVLLFATTECLARSHEARGANDTAVLAYIPTRSEHVNIFSSLTQIEQDDVTDFLTAQQNETLLVRWYSFPSTSLTLSIGSETTMQSTCLHCSLTRQTHFDTWTRMVHSRHGMLMCRYSGLAIRVSIW
jgi:hypothetical protein